MENNENKRISILVEEPDQQSEDLINGNEKSKLEKFKKPIIYLLMGIVFLGCLYMIFKPMGRAKEEKDGGLNGAVPQATKIGMQSDKQKAYEQALIDEKNQEKRNMLTSLSDYWIEDKSQQMNDSFPNRGQEAYTLEKTSPSANPALNSYRNAQATLGSFYNSNESYESNALRKEIEGLKQQLSERDASPAPLTVNDQLQLMEKSYQMAAKYLPNTGSDNGSVGTDSTNRKNHSLQKESFATVAPLHSNAVSALYREPTDKEFLDNVNGERNRGFYTAGLTEQISAPKNSIRASIHETTTVTIDGSVKLRLLEPAKTAGFTIASGTIVTAAAKFNGGRLQLKISSIESEGNIIPVDISIYDLDGQLGLNVPYSPEMNALTEIAANMSQSSGTSIMMTRSAGQQIASDLSRGAIQGVSGYFSKKMRTPKVMLKAGHQVFLISKK